VGLKEVPVPDTLAGRGLLWFELGGETELHIFVEDDIDKRSACHLCLEVADLDGLRRLTDFYADAAVPAVIAAGSTGEFHALSDDERKRVIETVVQPEGG
jgi:hypothetical protein